MGMVGQYGYEMSTTIGRRQFMGTGVAAATAMSLGRGWAKEAAEIGAGKRISAGRNGFT